jgi:hypothetical protein
MPPSPKKHKKHFYIDEFEIDNTSAAKTSVLPVEIGLGVGLNADGDVKLANGVLEGGPLPNGLLGHVNPDSGLLGTLGETLVGKNPLGLGGKGLGANFELDIPDLSLGLGLGNPPPRHETSPEGSLLGSILGGGSDDPLGGLLSSLLKL